jgi:hypothetical protein
VFHEGLKVREEREHIEARVVDHVCFALVLVWSTFLLSPNESSLTTFIRDIDFGSIFIRTNIIATSSSV